MFIQVYSVVWIAISIFQSLSRKPYCFLDLFSNTVSNSAVKAWCFRNRGSLVVQSSGSWAFSLNKTVYCMHWLWIKAFVFLKKKNEKMMLHMEEWRIVFLNSNRNKQTKNLKHSYRTAMLHGLHENIAKSANRIIACAGQFHVRKLHQLYTSLQGTIERKKLNNALAVSKRCFFFDILCMRCTNRILFGDSSSTSMVYGNGQIAELPVHVYIQHSSYHEKRPGFIFPYILFERIRIISAACRL